MTAGNNIPFITARKWHLCASRRLFRGVVLASLCCLTLAPIAVRQVYAETSGEALVITPEGNAGIGTADPKARLHIEGDARVSKSLQVLGKVGIGTFPPGSIQPKEPLEVRGTLQQGGRFIVSDGGEKKRRVILMEAPGRNSYARLLTYQYDDGNPVDLVLQDGARPGRIGIQTKEPKAALDINGDFMHRGLHVTNGGEPKLYPVSSRYHKTITAYVQPGQMMIPPEIMDSHCGDPDGCSIRLRIKVFDKDIQLNGVTHQLNLKNTTSTFLFHLDQAVGNQEITWGEVSLPQIPAPLPTDPDSCSFVRHKSGGYGVFGRFKNPERQCDITIID